MNKTDTFLRLDHLQKGRIGNRFTGAAVYTQNYLLIFQKYFILLVSNAKIHVRLTKG